MNKDQIQLKIKDKDKTISELRLNSTRDQIHPWSRPRLRLLLVDRIHRLPGRTHPHLHFTCILLPVVLLLARLHRNRIYHRGHSGHLRRTRRGDGGTQRREGRRGRDAIGTTKASKASRLGRTTHIIHKIRLTRLIRIIKL